MNNPEQIFVLSTLTKDGYPDSRLMGNICDKTIETVYFTCKTGTRKIDEIAQNPKASLYFTLKDTTVWLYGTASITRDKDIREKIWNDRMLRIYSEGVDSPRLTVIIFKTKKIRYRENNGGYCEFDL